MSRSRVKAVRNHLQWVVVLTALSSGSSLRAQDEDAVTSNEEDGRIVIDILAAVPQSRPDPIDEAECTRQQEAARISGEIVVCAPPRSHDQYRTTSDSQNRYAEETAFAGDPQTPDVAGSGIFKGPATVSGLCVIPPCPPPKAIIIDVQALPQAPPGSDADRIGRGLPPIGNDDGIDSIEEAAQRPANTGPVIDYDVPTGLPAETISPAESAKPEGRQ